MHMPELITINLNHTKFEMLTIIHSTYITGAPKFRNGSHDPDHAHPGDS